MRRDTATVYTDELGELGPRGAAHAAREPLALELIARQLVYLLIGSHLQAVFQSPQEYIGRIQLGNRRGGQ